VGLLTPKWQIGLLKPGQIAQIIVAVKQFPELVQLVSDFISEGHAIANGGDITSKALMVAKDVFTLFNTEATRKKLAAILAPVVQGAISNSSLLKTVLNFLINEDLTVARIAFFDEQYLLQAGVFLYDQGRLPTVLLQAVESEPTPPASTYPRLASAYHGTVTNLTVSAITTLALTNIVQNQQAISGNIIVGPGLLGTGTFTGTIAADGSVTFTDSDIVFSGVLSPDGSFGFPSLILARVWSPILPASTEMIPAKTSMRQESAPFVYTTAPFKVRSVSGLIPC
jgi:hypothetical protein